MKISLKRIAIYLALSASALPAMAQIVTVPVKTANNALVLQTDKEGYLHNIYLGKKLANEADYALINSQNRHSEHDNAYTPAGSRNLLEPAVAITHADGNQSLDLHYVSHKIIVIDGNVSLLTVELRDPVYKIGVQLFYKSYSKENVIEQWSAITNNENGAITLNKFASANLYLNTAKNYWLKHYHGDWAMEMRPEVEQLSHGIKTLDAKLGSRADYFQPPVFMLSMDKPATETEGEVLLGGMEWSGNFRNDFEVDPNNNFRLIAGINNYASAYQLKTGATFTTPAFVYTYSSTGAGDASRGMQNWARDYKLLDGGGTRLTLLNNWESTYFDFNEDKLKQLLANTKKLGVDLFLLDDGWFGNKFPRNDDHAGLGDWQENRAKLPNGLGVISKEAQKDGVKFGIWVEPEMVNPKSELYLKHPNWVVKQPKRDEYYMRNQLVLDLSNPQVQDFVYHTVDSLFIKSPGLAYIKWDCNSLMYNAYSAHLGKMQSQFYVDYVLGLYGVLKRLREKHPTTPMMLCSGGGGRVDYGALQYFTEYWPSDNTDPLERIFIQWEYSYFYPAIASANHVTDWGKQPLKFRVDVAMMGKLGFDIVVDKLGDKDLKFAQDAIKFYDGIKSIVWQGDQYRLADPWTNNVAAVMYVNPTKNNAVMFNYLVNNRYNQGSQGPIKMQGLDPKKKYRVQEVNLYPGEKSWLANEAVYSGDFLMNIGFNPQIESRRTSVVLQIVAEK